MVSPVIAQIKELSALPQETEWVEFKHNNENPQEVGEYISAISNSAALHHREKGFILWGIEDRTHKLVGTSFWPSKTRKGSESLEGWLSYLLYPRVDIRFREIFIGRLFFVILEVPAATYMPVRFKGEEYIRVGTSKKKLKDYPDKERVLWSIFRHETFEMAIASSSLSQDDIFSLIDVPKIYEMLHLSYPDSTVGMLERLENEGFILDSGSGLFDITNMGAILFAKKLDSFRGLSRKALRIVQYKNESKLETLREYLSLRGYASGFEDVLSYLESLLPRNEEIEKALRVEVCMYPSLAVRELVANALLHQDFSPAGTGPIVEIFSDRLEVTNPGIPLIDTLRFIDEPPRSRNEKLAAFMRRLNICEERGSGIDKVVSQVETYQLPAPDFLATPGHTRVILYAAKPLKDMSSTDKTRACYQHTCLQWVSNRDMTNTSLRERFGIDKGNSAIASRIIAETLRAGLIKPKDPQSIAKKQARYVPFWQ